MVIENEQDQLKHEEHLLKTFLEKTADLQNVRTRLFDSLDHSEKNDIAERFTLESGERPLLACVRPTESLALITNRRVCWQDKNTVPQSLAWAEISAINYGTNTIDVVGIVGNSLLVLLENGNAVDWTHWFLICLYNTYNMQQKGQQDQDAYVAHKYSSHHKNQILASKQCGCFYCLSIYPPSEIQSWVETEETALCPHCGIDSVIGDLSGHPISSDFLERMHRMWF